MAGLPIDWRVTGLGAAMEGLASHGKSGRNGGKRRYCAKDMLNGKSIWSGPYHASVSFAPSSEDPG